MLAGLLASLHAVPPIPTTGGGSGGTVVPLGAGAMWTLTDVRWADNPGLQDWMDLHGRNHRNLAAWLVQTRGLKTAVPPVYAGADADWFGRHWLVHQSLRRALNLPGSGGLAKSVDQWSDPNHFHDWIARHDQDHRVFSQALAGV